MKRMMAIALALIMLLAAAACAEGASNTITLNGLKLEYIEGGNAHAFDFPELQIDIAIGMSGLIPSLQVTFANGIEQQLGAITQIVGNEVLGSVGSISSVFALDLARLTSDEKAAGLLTLAISSTLSLGNVSLLGLLSAFTAEGEGGARVARADIPTAALLTIADNILEKAQGLDAAQSVDFQAIKAKLDGLNETLALDFSFNPQTGAIVLAVAQDDKTLRLSGIAAIGSADFDYADIDLTAGRIDVLNLSDEDIRTLNDELSLMAGRLISYAAATGLDQYLQDD